MHQSREAWLKTLEAACERVLARERGDPSDQSYAAVRKGVEKLLVQVRAELDGRI